MHFLTPSPRNTQSVPIFTIPSQDWVLVAMHFFCLMKILNFSNILIKKKLPAAWDLNHLNFREVKAASWGWPCLGEGRPLWQLCLGSRMSSISVLIWREGEKVQSCKNKVLEQIFLLIHNRSAIQSTWQRSWRRNKWRHLESCWSMTLTISHCIVNPFPKEDDTKEKTKLWENEADNPWPSFTEPKKSK